MTRTAPRRLGLLAVAVAGAWAGARLVTAGHGRPPARTAPWPPVPPVPAPSSPTGPMPATPPVPVASPSPATAEAAVPEATGRAIIVPPPPPPPAASAADRRAGEPTGAIPVPGGRAPARRPRAVTVASAAPGSVITRPLPPGELPPGELPPDDRASGEPPAADLPPGELPAWVEPVGTACPPTHPVKAKLSSHLYHLPGMLAYRRTHPDRCYRDDQAAERDGFVRAKR